MNSDVAYRTEIMLSVQRALLGAVTPNLRGVAVDWNASIQLIFYFDGPVSEDDHETMSCVHTEVATDFVDITTVDFVVKRLDMPAKMDGFRAWAFLRME